MNHLIPLRISKERKERCALESRAGRFLEMAALILRGGAPKDISPEPRLRPALPFQEVTPAFVSFETLLGIITPNASQYQRESGKVHYARPAKPLRQLVRSTKLLPAQHRSKSIRPPPKIQERRTRYLPAHPSPFRGFLSCYRKGAHPLASQSSVLP